MRSILAPGAILALALTLSGCTYSGSTSSTPWPATALISVYEYGYVDGDHTTSVTPFIVSWNVAGSVEHTVKWSDGTPESLRLSNGETYQRTFDTPGRYSYVCGIHGSMHGSITISP